MAGPASTRERRPVFSLSSINSCPWAVGPLLDITLALLGPAGRGAEIVGASQFVVNIWGLAQRSRAAVILVCAICDRAEICCDQSVTESDLS